MIVRRACMLVLDTSASMQGVSLVQLQDVLQKLVAGLKSEAVTTKALDLGILTLGSKVRRLQEMVPLHRIAVPTRLTAAGPAPVGQAVARALQALESQEAQYRQHGMTFSPSRLVVLGQGRATDDWQPVAAACRDLVHQGKLEIIAAGVGAGADLSVLGAFGDGHPLSLARLGMRAFVDTLQSRLTEDAGKLGTLSLIQPTDQGAGMSDQPPVRASRAAADKAPTRSLGADSGRPATLTAAPVNGTANQVPSSSLKIRHDSSTQHQSGRMEASESADDPWQGSCFRRRLMLTRTQRKNGKHKRASWPEPSPAQKLKQRLAKRHARSAHILEPAPELRIPPARAWFGAADTCVGAAHLRHEPPTPCQDAALVVAGDRPMLVVADGAGSSPVSDLGAEIVVMGLRRLVDSVSRQFRTVLDASDAPPDATARALAHTLVRHACGLLEDLASLHRRPVTDFRSTLLVAVGGRSHWLWSRVGDGALVVERDGTLKLLGETGKGEFANQTVFLGRELRPEQVQWGLEPTLGMTGLAAMTDGAAERLVSLDGSRISGQLATFFNEARNEKLSRTGLRSFLQEREVWRSTSGDDRGLAILACDEGEGVVKAGKDGM